MFAGRVKAPLWGDGGGDHRSLGAAKSARGREQAPQHLRQQVLHKTSAPDGERSRPGVGSAQSEAGAALARLRAAVNTRRRCKRRDRRSEAGRSPGPATKEEVAAMLPASATAQLSGAGTVSGSGNQVEVQHRVSHRRPRLLPRPPAPAAQARLPESSPGLARCPALGPASHAWPLPPGNLAGWVASWMDFSLWMATWV